MEQKMCYVIRYGEIALKGKNRITFERLLLKNIKDCLVANNVNFINLRKVVGRFLLYSEEDCSCIKNVMGIVSFSRSINIKFDIEKIKELSIQICTHKGLNKEKTFRVSTQRVDKTINTTSAELNKKIGADIVEIFHSKVSLKNPDIDVGIELVNKEAYLFTERIEGYSGLPMGIEGNSFALFTKKTFEKDILASWFMMKRGCEIIPVIYEKEKTNNFDFSLLQKFIFDKKIKPIEINLLNVLGTESKNYKSNSIIIGQTLDDFERIENETSLLILRPLITFFDEEIKEKIKEING